jgi:hypothetical protein
MIYLRIMGILFAMIIFLNGCSSGEWDGPTGESRDPYVIQVIPPSGSSNVSTTENIVAFFSKDMDPSTINNSTFVSRPPASGTVTYNADQRAAIFTPQGLSPRTTYYIQLTTGIKDTTGRAILTGYNWTFTTRW